MFSGEVCGCSSGSSGSPAPSRSGTGGNEDRSHPAPASGVPAAAALWTSSRGAWGGLWRPAEAGGPAREDSYNYIHRRVPGPAAPANHQERAGGEAGRPLSGREAFLPKGAPGAKGRRGRAAWALHAPPPLLRRVPAGRSGSRAPVAPGARRRPLAQGCARPALPPPGWGSGARRLGAATNALGGASASRTAGASRAELAASWGWRATAGSLDSAGGGFATPTPGARAGLRPSVSPPTLPGLWSSSHSMCRWGWKAMRASTRGAGLSGRACPALPGILTPVPRALRPASPPSLSPPRGRSGTLERPPPESGSAGHVFADPRVRSNKTGYKGTQLNRLFWSSPREGMEVNGQSVNRFQSQSRPPFRLTTGPS